MSCNILIWNARGVANANTQGIFHQLTLAHKLDLAAIIEPLSPPRTNILRKLGLEFKMANVNNKIWNLGRKDWKVECVRDTEQALHIRVTHQDLSRPIFISAVYGKCTRAGRLDLWESLREMAVSMEGHPWLVGGDFNIFLAEHELQGGQPIGSNKLLEMSDFADTINDCQLIDPGCDGPKFTWARGQLLERVDRVLLGEEWVAEFPITKVSVLPRSVSDHGLLLIRCSRTRLQPGFTVSFSEHVGAAPPILTRNYTTVECGNRGKRHDKGATQINSS